MNVNEIRAKVKEIIANVTNIDPDDVADDASFVDDLQLDSLSLLEIGVDLDYEYKLGVPEEELGKLRTVADAVDLVLRARQVQIEAEQAA
ncbi:MAG TPA: phosphopantetheine-binding protein [Thermoanaerobaculia bacterium]|jgi:acyl carrier protein